MAPCQHMTGMCGCCRLVAFNESWHHDMQGRISTRPAVHILCPRVSTKSLLQVLQDGTGQLKCKLQAVRLCRRCGMLTRLIACP
jgi:hypothetical protein